MKKPLKPTTLYQLWITVNMRRSGLSAANRYIPAWDIVKQGMHRPQKAGSIVQVVGDY